MANAEGEGLTIAANTWVEVKGSGLSTTSRTWGAADFVGNQLPTELDGVSVTMNGENAYVYYISGTQINVLTPPDLAAGPLQVVVNNSTGSSAVFASTVAAVAPAFFIASGSFVLATHSTNAGCEASGLPFCLVGPTSLYPGASLPALRAGKRSSYTRKRTWTDRSAGHQGLANANGKPADEANHLDREHSGDGDIRGADFAGTVSV